MRGIPLLWAVFIAGVSPLKLMTLKIWDISETGNKWQTRIYGGTAAKEAEYPFMIFILFGMENNGFGTCSASLLALDWVLTAAHCIKSSTYPREYIFLTGGTADLRNYTKERVNTSWNESLEGKNIEVQERRAKEVFIHPHYIQSEDTILHDIALIKLEKPFVAGKNIQTIPVSLDKIYSPLTCTILGWGYTPTYGNYQLNAVREKQISTTDIGCKYKKDGPMICLKPDNLSGICQGDSGSPLVCNGMVYGVASHMLTLTSTCGDSLEEYYMELSEEKEWIRSVLNAGSRPFQNNVYRAFSFVFITLWISYNISC